MPRLVGVDIPKEKRIEIALTYIFGVGRPLSNKILKISNISPDKRAKDLTEEEVARLSSVIQKDYKEKIKEMLDSGQSVHEISKKTGIRVDEVRKIKKENKLKINKY